MTATPAPRRQSVTPSNKPPEGWTDAGGTSVQCPWRGGSSQCLLRGFNVVHYTAHTVYKFFSFKVSMLLLITYCIDGILLIMLIFTQLCVVTFSVAGLRKRGGCGKSFWMITPGLRIG